MSERFRVLHVYPFVGIGGAYNAMMTLVEEHARRGPTFVMTLVDEPENARARAWGVTTINVMQGQPWPSQRIKRLTKAMRCLTDALPEHRIDIIHSHSAMGNHYCWPVAFKMRTPLVTHQRDNYRRDWFHFGLGGADQIITVSQWIKSGLPARLARRATAIHDAVELPESAPRSRVAGGRLSVGVAGRCYPTKGFDLLVDASLSLMPRLDFDVHVWGMNETEYSQEIRRKVEARSDVRDRFHLEPFRSDVENFYNAVDIAVVPSRYPDPFPRTVTEAMARYKCTIAAGHGGMVEIVDNGGNGFTFKPGDAGDLAQVLEKVVIDDQLRQSLAIEGRRAVERKLAASLYADAIDVVYRKAYEIRRGVTSASR